FAEVIENDDRIAHVQNVIALMTADLQPSLVRRYLGAMRPEMIKLGRSTRFFCALLISASACAICCAAEPVAELSSFSVFDKVDLNELKAGAKTVHGPPMGGRYLSVQTCYVMPGAPSRQVETMKRWDPIKY